MAAAALGVLELVDHVVLQLHEGVLSQRLGEHLLRDGGGQHAEAPVLAVRDLNPARARAHGWLALRRLCGAQRRLT